MKDSELDIERRLREQIVAARADGNTVEALRLARHLAKVEKEIDGIGSCNHTEEYGRHHGIPFALYASPQMDDYSEESEP